MLCYKTKVTLQESRPHIRLLNRDSAVKSSASKWLEVLRTCCYHIQNFCCSVFIYASNAYFTNRKEWESLKKRENCGGWGGEVLLEAGVEREGILCGVHASRGKWEQDSQCILTCHQESESMLHHPYEWTALHLGENTVSYLPGSP